MPPASIQADAGLTRPGAAARTAGSERDGSVDKLEERDGNADTLEYPALGTVA